jgi:hypothetical protein
MSNPVSPEELKNHVKLAKLPPRPPPKPGQKAPPRRLDPATDHWLGVAPKLGESYTVTVAAGMRDIYGQKLEKDATFELVVEAPLVKPDGAAVAAAAAAPASSAKPKGRPIKGAPVANDQRPRRERLPYQLDLGLVGQVLEAGGGHKIPVGAVNVPTYATLAASLTDAQATSWALARGTTSDFISRNGFSST